MTQTHTEAGHGEHHEHPNYMAVFAILCVLTLVSFLTVSPLWPKSLAGTGNALVMVVAVCKAVLVAMFFMHLKYDWFKLYFMIVPTLIMSTFMICALLPDQTFSSYRIQGDSPPSAVQVR